MIYITKFENNEEYNSLKNSLKLPNISVSLEEQMVYYNSYLEENQVLCKYNVTDTTSTTKLLNTDSSFASMSIDGVEQSEVISLYTFNTTGEHTVKFTLSEGETSIGNNAFRNCSELTSVIIPDLVTSIGSSAFLGCSGLTSVTIPDSVTLISEHAFYNCSSLTSVIIPGSVTSIGNYAFRYCSGLTSVIIPDSVISIGNSAFGSCSSLTSIIVDSNNQTYDSRNNSNAIIETSTNTLIMGCKNTIIPSSVTSIGSDAFFYCYELTSITIPDSVTSIGSGAFCGCSGLTSVIIPDSVTSIGDYAFQGCSGLISVTIGNSVTSIGNAFYICSGLTNIICNATSAPTITYRTFESIKSNGILTVPAGSTGYDVWMGTGGYYLGYYNWTKVEQ